MHKPQSSLPHGGLVEPHHQHGEHTLLALPSQALGPLALVGLQAMVGEEFAHGVGWHVVSGGCTLQASPPCITPHLELVLEGAPLGEACLPHTPKGDA